MRKFSMCLDFLAVITLPLAAFPSAAVAAEPALARSASDPNLDWGPCPEFFPTGCEIAVLHGDPAEANADIFFRVPGNYDLPKHWHSSAERMVLVAGELSVTYEGQAAVNLNPGMYAYGPPQAVHHGRCVSEHACTLFIAFEKAIDATPVTPPAEP